MLNSQRKNKRLKKLFLIAFLNAYSEGLSGSDIRFVEVFKRITDVINTRLFVITSRLGKDLCEKKQLKATFKITSNEETFGNVFLIYAKRTFSALFLNFKIDNETFLYGTSDFLPDVFPIYLLKLRNRRIKWIQVIHHVQGNPFGRVGGSFLVNLFVFLSQRISFKLIKRSSNLIIVVNPVIKDQLVNIGFSEEKLSINYNGVDLQKIKSFEVSKLRYDSVFLGRLNVSKGVFDLVRVWNYVVAKNPNAKLAIIGRGDSQIQEKLRSYVSKMQLDKNIAFCGHLNDDDAFGLLKSAKCFLFPSYEEGFGIAVLQAMACSLPVVAYDLPVYGEIFGGTLVKVPAGCTDLMAERVSFLLEHPEEAKSIGKAGVNLATGYDWSQIALRELELIESVRDS